MGVENSLLKRKEGEDKPVMTDKQVENLTELILRYPDFEVSYAYEIGLYILKMSMKYFDVNIMPSIRRLSDVGGETYFKTTEMQIQLDEKAMTKLIGDKNVENK